MIKASVIIPTYNNKKVLQITLLALGKQSFPLKNFEVIIVDDGSTDDTLKAIKKLAAGLEYKTVILSQKKLGPGAARNKGIKKACGPIVLILNDDTIAASDLIERHLNFHNAHPEKEIALLGYVTWHPKIRITPFMYWLEHGGPYFSFREIKGNNAGWERFWTCNISLKREFLMENGLFDEDFPYAAWEDVELGYRLGKAGLKLMYDKNAYGLHYHPTTIKSIEKKMINNGFATLILKKKIPGQYLPPIGRFPRLFNFSDYFFLNPAITFVLKNACLFFEDKLNLGISYDLLLLHYRIKGIRKFLNQ